jgi:cell division protein FtsZ
VIINVTGGPDLSLVEVCEASSIVQAAAHEDANIIFGAVVDPDLKGKVKITVIATGFGSPAAAHGSVMSATAQTPVDMTQYAQAGRVRPEPATPVAAERNLLSRLSIARRPSLELPLSAPAVGSVAPQASTDAMDPDAEASSAFDVPAFLRRLEG